MSTFAQVKINYVIRRDSWHPLDLVLKNPYTGTMSTDRQSKINQFLDEHKPGTVCLASWLEAQGISYELQKRYRQSGWLESVGKGAFKRPKEEIQWQGGLYALQKQVDLPIHAGALTALAMQGLAHYFRVARERVFLFSPYKTHLPVWYKNYTWGNPIKHVQTSFLPRKLGLTEGELKTFSITISTPERAILECLYLAPSQVDLVECYQVMEGLVNLRPKLLQELLEQCASVKVKRVFLYMAQKVGHQWLSRLDRDKIDLGKGKRSLVKGGVLDAEFQITLPRELVNYDF